MAAATPVVLTKKSQECFIAFYKNIQARNNANRGTFRSRLETIDREYQREMDASSEHRQAKNANKAGDSSRFQNMTVPVIMPQVEAAVTYQASVFLTGEPLFGVVASPQFIDEALQMETVISEESIRGGWVRQLMLAMRNGFKYNFGPVELDWSREVTSVVTTDLAKSATKGIPKEVIWEGNSLTALDPYNTFVDMSVPPTEVYSRGEYAGHTELIGRIELKSRLAALPDKLISNISAALESGCSHGATVDSSSMSYFIPDINEEVDETQLRGEGTNWLQWAGLSSTRKDIDYKDRYEYTVLYARILPSEFDLRLQASNTPQIYKLIIINHQHIVYCELQTNAHNYIPIFIMQPLEDGLRYQTKSLGENGIPFQNLASSYANSIIASRRRAISDRCLYDPSRVEAAHINSANPSAKIPVRPAAYGSKISEAVYHFPYNEDQASNSLQQIQTILGLSNALAGQNQAQQGQFVKGNKTLHEFESVMQNANGRDQLVSILLEHQVFVPLKHVLKTNILQFQGGTSLYNRKEDKVVEIDPVALRKAVMAFRISDGLIPADKILNSEGFSVALQVLGSSPQLAAGYNVSQLFSYMMKTQGADIADFEKAPEQLAYEQAMQSWQSMAQLALEKGVDPNKALPPMPLPEQFGYNPAQNKPTPQEAQSQQPPQTLTGLQ
jgi:hypothetical protein